MPETVRVYLRTDDHQALQTTGEPSQHCLARRGGGCSTDRLADTETRSLFRACGCGRGERPRGAASPGPTGRAAGAGDGSCPGQQALPRELGPEPQGERWMCALIGAASRAPAPGIFVGQVSGTWPGVPPPRPPLAGVLGSMLPWGSPGAQLHRSADPTAAFMCSSPQRGRHGRGRPPPQSPPRPRARGRGFKVPREQAPCGAG